MTRTDATLHHVGIFGRRTCGKTTLAVQLCAGSFAAEKRYSLVLDPKSHQHTWGKHALNFTDRAKWLAAWQRPECKNCNIVWEETATTLKRDAALLDVFTMKAGEHGHRLIITGHGFASLTPTMRDQLTEVFLFRQHENEAKEWAMHFADARVAEACTLDFEKHEFLFVRMGRPPVRQFLTRK